MYYIQCPIKNDRNAKKQEIVTQSQEKIQSIVNTAKWVYVLDITDKASKVLLKVYTRNYEKWN